MDADYFTNLPVKKLRRMAGGSTYTIIYLKLQLLSLQNGGYLYYEGVEDEIYEEFATILDETVEDVQMTWMYLLNHGLAIEEDQAYLLPEAAERIGSITDSALRSRKSRLKRRNQELALQCNTSATQLQPPKSENKVGVAMQHTCNAPETNCNLEREREKDIDIYKEREEETQGTRPLKNYTGELDNVFLSDEEYEALQEKYEDVKMLIDHVGRIMANTSPKNNHYAYVLKIAVEDRWPKKKNRVVALPLKEQKENVESKESDGSEECLGMPEDMRRELEKKYGVKIGQR